MIQVNSISKKFGQIQALNDITLSINKGDVYGLLGPNGAGKSTTINILNTLFEQDSGEVIIDGLNLNSNRDKIKLILGIVPQEIALYDNLTAYDNLMFWGELYNIPKAKLKVKVDETLKLVGLIDRKNDRVKTFSGGMKRRINIAASILHTPKVLLMDEPTVGVDPQSRNHIFEIIEKLNKEGMTVIYTTHYMEEAERLCNKIAIIDTGTIIAQGTLSELRSISKVKDLLIIELANLNESSLQLLKNEVSSIQKNSTKDTLHLEFDDIATEISTIINKIQNHGGIIKRIDTKKANLETIFLNLTGKELRDS